MLLAGWEKNNGDFGAYTERALKIYDGTFKNPHKISISTVNELLIQLASKNRFSDPSIQKLRKLDFDTDKELANLLKKFRSSEAKWVVRLILRQFCTIDWDEDFVFRQYHFLLPDLLQFQNDFEIACRLLRRELSCFPPVPENYKERDMRIEAATKLRAVVGTKVGRPTFHKAWSFKNLFQLTGDCAWAAEVKYDGEYCEIHIDLEKEPDIKIFSKNGKDATNDRRALQDDIRKALRLGEPSCPIKKNCIVLGEMVLWSDQEQKILPFFKIRKHISRSGSFLGTMQDSAPHEWEHLMLVFFDVLVVDDKPILRKDWETRRDVLKKLVRYIPGCAMRSEWSRIDCSKVKDGETDLKQAFALSLAQRQGGLVLKPLHAPYFPLLSDVGHRHRGYFIKLKKDYLADMVGERDLGDFVVIGASLDAHVAAKSDVKPLHWTHFHLGCLVNKSAVERAKAKPIFKVVSALSLDKCIPKPELKYLNTYGRLREVSLPSNGQTRAFTVLASMGYGPKMTIAFKEPFVVEILGGGYERQENEDFEMLRHPRLKKIHHDRGWMDAVTVEELESMAEKWEISDATKLDGHARDVALLVKRYARVYGSQSTVSDVEPTQESTQRTAQRTSQETPRMFARGTQHMSTPETQQSSTQETPPAVVEETQQTEAPETQPGAVIQETQPHTQCSWSTASSTCIPGSTQGVGIKASRQLRSILVREDTSERIARETAPLPTPSDESATHPEVAPAASASPRKRRRDEPLTPPPLKRRRVRTPLGDTRSNKNLGTLELDSRDKAIHETAPLPTPNDDSATPPEDRNTSSLLKRRMDEELTPPPMKRSRIRSPLKDTRTNKNLGSFELDSQEKTIHIYAKQGWRVKVHGG